MRVRDVRCLTARVQPSRTQLEVVGFGKICLFCIDISFSWNARFPFFLYSSHALISMCSLNILNGFKGNNIELIATALTFTSSECNVWFDSASKKRKRGFVKDQINQRLEALADEFERPKPKKFNTASLKSSWNHEDEPLSSDEDEETDITPFKRLSFDRGLLEFSLPDLNRLIKENTHTASFSNAQMQRLYDRLFRCAGRPNFQLLNLLYDIQNNAPSWPFLEPISKYVVADYYDVIKEPMDLSTMEAKLAMGLYPQPEDFFKDAKLIFDNCRKYNDENTIYTKLANKLESFMWTQIKAIPEWSVCDF